MPQPLLNADGVYVYASVLDILGYRNRLDQDRLSGNPTFKNLLQNALAALNLINEAQCGVQVISDTIFLTWSVQATLRQFLEINKRVFVAFLEQGLFLRGGIAYSEHFKSGPVTYSYAFAGAYELESKSAIYPRIVVSEDVIEMFQSNDSGLDYQGLVQSKLIVRSNGTYFINIIDEINWVHLREKAESLFLHDSTSLVRQESAFSKHVWFENYLYQSRHVSIEDRYIPRPKLITLLEQETSDLPSDDGSTGS